MFTDYYSAMDRYYGRLQPSDVPSAPSHPVEVSGLGPAEIGTSTNPMQHQVSAFAAKIREGAGRIELSFIGAGKSNSQQPSPEAFGVRDREDIRALAEINKIKTSVHASVHAGGLSGLGREGFSGEARQNVLKEIERAVQFASEATKGGAIVFHTGEWQRPMSEMKYGGLKFSGYDDEKDKAPKIVVDDRTGEIMPVRKDHLVYEPKFYTAKEYQGGKFVGRRDKNGNTVNADDWIDIDGNAIKRIWVLDEKKVEQLFERVPIFLEGTTNFDVRPVDFKEYEKQAEEFSKEGKNVTAEELFFKSQLAINVLQAKGQSLYHAQRYSQYREAREAAQKALEFYKQMDKSLPDDQKWKLMTQKGYLADINQFAPPKNIPIPDYLQEQVKRLTDEMRHVHESSAHADATAKQTIDRMNHIKRIEEYGLAKTAETVARAGLMAREYYLAHKKDLDEPLFVAPENYRPEQYGSHPEEIRDIVMKSREEMAKRLRNQHPGMSKEDAAAEAKKHIGATVDIGHFNLWRQFYQGDPKDSPEQRHKKFEKWALDETEKLAKEGIISHIHITDNFGFDDEHITPGQGNAPVKEFLKRMEKHGVKGMIAEAGSFNGTTVMHDTWSLMGSPVYGIGRAPSTFRGVHQQHFGYHNPSAYIVGAYSPSNEWRLWTEVPFE